MAGGLPKQRLARAQLSKLGKRRLRGAGITRRRRAPTFSIRLSFFVSGIPVMKVSSGTSSTMSRRRYREGDRHRQPPEGAARPCPPGNR